MHSRVSLLIACSLTILSGCATSRGSPTTQANKLVDGRTLMPLGIAWAQNSVNAVIFRNDSITTAGDRQFAAYYDAAGRVMIATRKIGSTHWSESATQFHGDVTDAHDCISLIADGDGYLHLSWDHHDRPLRYARSKRPGVADFADSMPMTGITETHVSYPQFFGLPNGNLIFFYRTGGSGRGDIVLNRYDVKKKTWTQLSNNLIAGENRRNAYWQSAVGADGSIQLSWIWRESSDVASNHDICFARSDDEGTTWTKSDGTKYALPINQRSAEIACPVPQKQELINQTSMCVDGRGRPIIATYFRAPGDSVVQYYIVYHDSNGWKRVRVLQRTQAFTLSGGGSKQIPISRPLVVARMDASGSTAVSMVYREVGLNGGRAMMASCPSVDQPNWSTRELTDFDVKYWEPTLDHNRWARDGVLDVYMQVAGQGDSETLQDVPPQRAYVLEVTP